MSGGWLPGMQRTPKMATEPTLRPPSWVESRAFPGLCTPVRACFPCPAGVRFSPLSSQSSSSPDPHAHLCVAHGSLPLLGTGILALPHVDLQAPLVQDVTVLEVERKTLRESLTVWRSWAGELRAQKSSLPHWPGPLVLLLLEGM